MLYDWLAKNAEKNTSDNGNQNSASAAEFRPL
jgi:hypothetical protein